MLGDRDAAQDVVQDAFFGLYRRWDGLASADAAPAYLRTSVRTPRRAARCSSSPGGQLLRPDRRDPGRTLGGGAGAVTLNTPPVSGRRSGTTRHYATSEAPSRGERDEES